MQQGKIVEIVEKNILVNANWAMASLIKIACGEIEPDSTPFSICEAEEFMKRTSSNQENGEYLEFYECWVVNKILSYHLKQAGEFVINTNNYGSFWFRTCTGQAIYLDTVVKEISKKMRMQ
jgi:hypothetical protein